MFVQNRFSLSTVRLTLLALLCWLSIDLVFFWGYTAKLLGLLSVLALAVMACERRAIPVQRLALAVGAALGILVYSTMYGASPLGSAYLGGFVVMLVLLDDHELESLFNKFTTVFALSLVPGLIIWFVHHVTGNFDLFLISYVPDHLVPNQMKVEEGFRYAIYPLTTALNFYDFAYENYYRFQGPYDEPGVVGTLGALILSVNRFNVRRLSNVIIIAGGLLSFSLAFYILGALYIFMSVARTRSALIALPLIVLLMAVLGSQSEIFDQEIIQRLTLTSEGGIAGDNRESDLMAANFARWSQESLVPFFVGIGDYGADHSSSWKLLLIKTGLLGFLFLSLAYSLMFLRFYRGGLGQLCVFLLVYLASAYQRPDLAQPAYILIFGSGVLLAARDYRRGQKKTLADASSAPSGRKLIM